MSENKIFERTIAYVFFVILTITYFYAFTNEPWDGQRNIVFGMWVSFMMMLIKLHTWPSFKLWHERVFRVITLERAAELQLQWTTNIHGDSINVFGCRSLWHDAIGRVYRVSDMRAIHTAEIRFKINSPVECSKEQFEEWIMANLNLSLVSESNPLKREKFNPVVVSIDDNAEQK